MYEITMSKMFLQTVNINHEPTPKSPINWILSDFYDKSKHLLIRTLRLHSVSGFPLNCLFGAESIMDIPYDRFVKNKY
jgi:hypothetical protein